MNMNDHSRQGMLNLHSLTVSQNIEHTLDSSTPLAK